MTTFAVLSDETILFRAILEKSWKTKDGNLKWQTFKRMKKDVDGVSIFTTTEAAEENLQRPFFGMASVNVGKVRNSSFEENILDVIQDAETHANITGIPYIYDKPENEQVALSDKMTFLCRRIAENAAKILPE
jgi:hypothetical protein